jgi:beta-glucosidase
MFFDGTDPAAAAAAARDADVAVVFATQWAGESFDVSLTLPNNQDELIAKIAAANDRTVVVLETGASVLTPWRSEVDAILAAWFPGTQGAEAIADVLVGRINPSGRLPITFADSLDQLPHPQPPAKGDVRYTEGALVGYKWFDAHRHAPAFPFGHGLSYTTFGYDGLAAVVAGDSVTVRFRIANSGKVAGKAVPQIYVSGPGIAEPKRLAGFDKVELAPGASSEVAITLDPRMLATFEGANGWRIAGGTYRFHLARSSRDMVDSIAVRMPASTVPTNRF